ncbi:hypothetical protein Ddc_15376 [Ditylenchus destructor]|nr:hypothetical protein Ddc_15376 [Ditylenchus destructor]
MGTGLWLFSSMGDETSQMIKRSCSQPNACEGNVRIRTKHSPWILRNTKKSDQDYYVCRYARTKGFNCKAKLKVIFDATSEAVNVWKSSEEHSHVPDPEVAGALTEEVKTKI